MKNSSYLARQLCRGHIKQGLFIQKKISFDLSRIEMGYQPIQGTNERCLAAAAPPGQQDKLYPVFARASYTSSDKLGHRFLIDQYSTTTTEYKYTYGLIVDPWTGEGANPWEDNERDEYGNIIGYPYTNEVERTSTSDRISMNWGNDLSNNSTMYYPTGSWNSNNRDYKYNRTILKRSDIK